MWKRRRTWFLRRLALGLAAAAIVAPAAQAYPDPGPQSDLRVQGTVCVPKWGCQTTGPIRPDDRATRGVESTDVQPQVAPRVWPGVDPTTAQDYGKYSYRRALPQDNGGATQVAGPPRRAPFVGTNTASDVDWADLGIGAGLAFGLVLLVAGATVGMRHRHTSATA
jgi:hypothetical protein